ncbi:DUF4177 domain-containing protein [Xanthomonas sp. XNM01]|jgi:hypothetical protein|uniref:DUF4177 domain-containing protein n=1 Tax=Xanthomonas sp. XNM01 TaxID=2769289 RepID=UPI00178511D7|nr:DUF4177 domain-containing protein [Xanthomonas sp. XNM01]MBD9368666.1 DUF4177 domain-containing protein [Xanthomonas sp. XNM01]
MTQRWKYQVIEIKPGIMGGFRADTVQEELSRQGRLGWELVQVVANGPLVPMMMVFKQPE